MLLSLNLMKFIQLQFVVWVVVVYFRAVGFLLRFYHPVVDQYNYIYIKSMSISEFDEKFLSAFQQLGSTTLAEYKESIDVYKKYIVPFEIKRMKDNQNLSFRNTSLQNDKVELLNKVQQYTSQIKQAQYVMENQLLKINDLERTIADMQKINEENLSVIQAMKFVNKELEESLNQKIEIIKQVEQDKTQVLKDIQAKKNQYNHLLSNYMNDKNSIAEKLNYMNELELSLLDKDKQLKEQQFYLKKQWQEFQQAKKAQNTPQPSIIPNRPFRKSGTIPQNMEFNEKQEQSDKMKYERVQILRHPLKKIHKHHNNQIYDLSFNYNGSMVATCGGDRQIKTYDVLSGKSGISINSNSAQNIYISLSLDYGGDKILAGSTDKSVHIFSSSSGKELHSFVGHGYKINGVSWSSSKQKCVSGSDDKQIKIWDIEKTSNLLSIQCGKAVKTVVCNTVQPIVYSGHSDGSVRIYSLTQSSNPISQIKGIIDYPINYISLLSNRHQVLVSSQEGYRIHLFDFKMNKSITKYQYKDFFNTSMRADVSPSESFVVAGNCDGYLYYWNKTKGSFEKKVSGHDSPVTTLKYHFLSGILASCDKQGSVILWQ